MIKIKFPILLFAVFYLLFLQIVAAEEQVPDVDERQALYIIFDGSNSMWGELPDKSRKIETAKEVFDKLDTSLFSDREVALRLYGHRKTSDCSDTELVIPFASSDDVKKRLSKAINKVTPRGKTPITRSLKAALEDFDGRHGEILLISDGIETCDADPCELIESWRKQNINIRVHVVGLGLNDMARGAMQCISDASGTVYMDANNVDELSEAIAITADAVKPPAGHAEPQPREVGPEFKISGLDNGGNYVPVSGTLFREGMEPEKIQSNRRYVFAGGDYTIQVGVPTVNGEIYKPITKEIKIKDSGSTKITVRLERPPMIRTKFVQKGKEIRGANSYAYVGESEQFRLRPAEDFYVMPGTYEFRSNLNQDNSDLRVSETITAGTDKTIVFKLIETVHTVFKVVDKASDQVLRQHQELWQDGELKYKVHYNNGKKVKPGLYTLISNSVLTPYRIENVEVSPVIKPGERHQTLDFAVSFGKARINYFFNEEPNLTDRRCWIYPVDEAGNKASRGSKAKTCDGIQEITLAQGRYYVYPYSYLGEFEDTYFDVKLNETAIVDVKQK